MRSISFIAAASIITLLSACASNQLNVIQAYPTADDVCVLVKNSGITARLNNNADTLLACPSHEQGAISDRVSEGAKILGEVKASTASFPNTDWTILSLAP